MKLYEARTGKLVTTKDFEGDRFGDSFRLDEPCSDSRSVFDQSKTYEEETIGLPSSSALRTALADVIL